MVSSILLCLIFVLLIAILLFSVLSYLSRRRRERYQEESLSRAISQIESPKDEVRALREELDRRLNDFQVNMSRSMEVFFSNLNSLEKSVRESFDKERVGLQDGFDKIRRENAESLNRISDKTDKLTETVRETLDKIRDENSKKLDEIRKTVDEKLQETLEDRITKSFKEVQNNLNKLYESLGSLKQLTGDVENINRVFSNVKSRGVWGEEEADALLSEILAPDQYVRDFSPKNNSERVEFAVKFPSKGGKSAVYLPIDSKFPVSAYERYKEAYDKRDYAQMESALNELKKNIKEQANKIVKYINTPITTDFAVLFVPVESIFSELMSMRDLMESLEEKRILLTGPTTFSALLNTLRLAFKTMQIEAYTSQIWKSFENLKGQFRTMGANLDSTKKSMDKAQEELMKAVKSKDKIDEVLVSIEKSGEGAYLPDDSDPPLLNEN